MSEKLEETFEKLSGKILEIYDVELSKEITDVYEDLVSHTANLIDEHNKLEGRYWDLVKIKSSRNARRNEIGNARRYLCMRNVTGNS